MARAWTISYVGREMVPNGVRAWLVIDREVIGAVGEGVAQACGKLSICEWQADANAAPTSEVLVLAKSEIRTCVTKGLFTI